MDLDKLKAIVTETHRKKGDALAGESIIAQARKIGPLQVVHGSSKHKIQQVILKSNVLCVIDRPFKTTGGGLRLKKK